MEKEVSLPCVPLSECRHGHLELGNQQKPAQGFPVSGKRADSLSSSKFRESLVEAVPKRQLIPGALHLHTRQASGLWLPRPQGQRAADMGGRPEASVPGRPHRECGKHRQPLPGAL